MTRRAIHQPRRVLVERDAAGSPWRQPPTAPSSRERHAALDRALGVAGVVGRWSGRVAWAVAQAVLPG